jgi:integrase
MAETTLLRNGDPLAKGSKAKIRNIMSALYSPAIRWEWTTSNPITSVRQSAKRQKIPEILTVDELVSLLDAIREPFRTAVFLDGASGLRVGELLGLKWEDVDFERNLINIKRGWHTFRHTFGTLLNANGENPKSFRNCCVMQTSKLRWTLTFKL